MRATRAFGDRSDAGRALAGALGSYSGRDDVVVLGLPRGGVPVAAEVATVLAAPFDVLVVRKLGVPGHAELAMGAIADGGIRVLNPHVVSSFAISDAVVDEVVVTEQAELDRRRRTYRGDRPPPDLASKVVILVDDGLATGATMRAAVVVVRALGPRRVVVAVPVGAAATCRDLESMADEIVCVRCPVDFQAVGEWYVDFDPPGDDEVRRLLAENPPGGAIMA
ncbi:MAG: phosphoribosyltransferase [Acidimicrobiia bacterium]|nr:phosphoribosyltransferase [Acidimicrobiia bacterium]